MNKILLLTFVFALGAFCGKAQSIEVMPGNENVFSDVQLLKPLIKNDYRFTVFNRTRTVLDYDNNANLLTLAYANYTHKTGFGFSALGSIGSTSGLGINYFKKTDHFSIFALVASELESIPGYSFFTITKWKPAINERWKLYTSVELLSLVNKLGHQISIQRLRLGIEKGQYQFGFAANVSFLGDKWVNNGNYGPFFRIEFN